MSDVIMFAKNNPNAIIPTKREGDGWYDIYACFDEDRMAIQPNEVKLIPTGIVSCFDNKYRISIGERGSNTKSGLHVMAGKIDASFRGVYFVALHNINNETVILYKDAQVPEDKRGTVFIDNEIKYVPISKAIAQFAIEEVPKVQIQETSYEYIMSQTTERGTGMLGSSGK